MGTLPTDEEMKPYMAKGAIYLVTLRKTRPDLTPWPKEFDPDVLAAIAGMMWAAAHDPADITQPPESMYQ